MCGNPDDPKLMGFCLTEAGAGSDAAAVATVARLDGDEWVINGRKCFISNAGLCVAYAVFATVDRSKGVRGITGFLVPADTPGVSVGKVEDKMGMRTSTTAEIILDNVRVPKENMLGQEGGGFGIAMRVLDLYRPLNCGAVSVGLARAAFDAARQYCRQRVAFDRSGFEQQAISFQLADMASAIEVARLLVWKTCWLIDNKKPFGAESAMSKYFSSDMAVKVCSDAVGLVGLDSYSADYPVEKFLRDAKLLQIYEGTNQIQRTIVARQVIAA
jgi:alkylation response protein AidB-like acyl-CoA dehydrogenase